MAPLSYPAILTLQHRIGFSRNMGTIASGASKGMVYLHHIEYIGRSFSHTLHIQKISRLQLRQSNHIHVQTSIAECHILHQTVHPVLCFLLAGYRRINVYPLGALQQWLCLVSEGDLIRELSFGLDQLRLIRIGASGIDRLG